ncbi:MAG: carboxypeptidase regulatory-like domain-containing protein [Acidobacteriota bacterium]
MRFRFIAALAAMLIISTISRGQGIITPRRSQSNAQSALAVSAIKINARITGRIATVRVEQVFRNDTDETLEGDYRFLIPAGATLVEFAVYDGETRRSNRATAAQRRVFEARIHPLPPRSDKRVEIVYSLPIAERKGIATFEYDLGREYKKLRASVGRVEIEVEVRSGLAIRSLTSPTHRIDIKWDDSRHVTARASFGNAERFRLVYSQSDEEIGRDEASRGSGAGRRFSNSSTGAKDFAAAQPPQGAVVDSNGAAIPNATVTIRDQSTGMTRTQITDESGNYSVAGLPPGTYKIEVDAPGFKKSVVENVAVQPGQVAATGVTMSPGSVAETVTVTSVAPAIDTSIARASSYESANLRDLPSLAPVDSLARLAPGATSRQLAPPSAQSPGTDRNDEFRFWFNGNQSRSNNFSLDGHDNNSIDGRPAISVNNFDSIDTLHIMTTRGTGETTLTGASSVNMQTRAGSNDFHGTVFDFHLNSRFSALSPLERRSGMDSAPLMRSNRYGGTFGGPARRDRFFFFGAFEGEAESSERFIDSTSSHLTPTRRGLGQLKDAFPSSPTVNDLIRRGPMTVGSPQTGRTFLIPVAGVPVEFGQTTRLIASKAEGYEATARLDFNLTLRDTLRVGYWFSTRSATDSAGRLAAGLAADTRVRSQLANLHWDRTLSPRTSNEARFTFNRAHLALGSEDETALDGPGVSTGFRGLGYGQSAFLPASHASTLFEAGDTLAHIAGRHNIKLGGQWRRRSADFDYLPGAGGQFSFASFEDFVLDRPATITIAAGDARSHFSQLHQHYFIDDVWRVKSNLTLSFGLSYENTTQPINSLAERLRNRESDAATALFDSTLPLNSPAIAGLRRDNNNFAPRLGFAYTPRFFVLGRDLFGFDKTVIRGGLQMAYEQTAFRPLADVAASAPNVMLAVITPSLGSLRFPAIPDAEKLRSLLGSDASKYARTDLSRDYRTPYATVWHLTFSRELTERLSVEAAYAGSRGKKLIRAIDGATGNGPLRIYETSGRSIYHSFQTRIDLRPTRLLESGASYTLSKLIDDVADNNASIAGGAGDRASLLAPALQMFAQNPFDVEERALSSLDRRHSLTGHFVLTLPWQRGQSGLLGRFAGGWKASGIIQFASGSPFTPLQYISPRPASFAAALSDRLGSVRPFAGNAAAPRDAVAFSNAANRALHFFLNSDGTPFISPTGFIIADRAGFRAGGIDEARFIYNDYIVEQMARAMGLAADAFGETFAAGRRFGDVGRNTLTGPRVATVDFALIKTTKITEKVSLQFRAEYYNLFNHPNRARSNSLVENAGGFGFLDAGETDSIPRRIRFALKLIF